MEYDLEVFSHSTSVLIYVVLATRLFSLTKCSAIMKLSIFTKFTNHY
jgi:hypothetical protein